MTELTIEQILNMPADREMDAFIEEALYPERTIGTQRLSSYIKLPNGYGDLRHIPHYSTDIVYAWRAVEVLRGKGKDVEVASNEIRQNNKFVKVYCVNFENSSLKNVEWWSINNGDFGVALGETIELAICRSILISVYGRH